MLSQILTITIVFSATVSRSALNKVNSVKLKTQSGDIAVTIYEGDSLLVDNENCEINVENSKIEVICKSEDLEVWVPPWLSLCINSVSGDIKVMADSISTFPPKLSISSISGDIELSPPLPSETEIHSLTGDVDIKGNFIGNSDAWKDSKYRISTVSGDIFINGVVPCNVEAASVSGNIELFLDEEPPQNVNDVQYEIDTKGSVKILINGEKVDVKEEEPLKYGGITITVREGTVEQEEEQGCEKKMAFRINKTPRVGPFDYNRVDGFLLGIAPSFGEKDKFGDFAQFGIAYAFSRKKWQGFLTLRKALVSKPRLYILGQAFSTTATRDKWKISDVENFMASFLIKKDFRNYYHREGISIALGISPIEHLIGEIGYEMINIKSLEKHTDWALFCKNKKFRDNPPVKEGTLRALTFRLREKLGPVAVFMNHEFSLNDDYNLKRFWNEITFDKNFSHEQEISARLIGAFSPDSLPRPFVFTAGGIGSLPAYDFEEFSGRYMALVNIDYSVEIGWQRFLIFFDAAKIEGVEDIKADVGLGLIPFENVSIRAVRKLEKTSDIKLYIRLTKRF